jgi:hypothetical protein
LPKYPYHKEFYTMSELVPSDPTPAPPAAPEVPPTRQTPVERVPALPAEKVMPTTAQRRKGGMSAGKLQRMVAVIGLGTEVPAIDLKTPEGQVAILEAVVRALAGGKTSGLVASSITAAVKAAAEIVRHDQSELLQEQAALIDRLRRA